MSHLIKKVFFLSCVVLLLGLCIVDISLASCDAGHKYSQTDSYTNASNGFYSNTHSTTVEDSSYCRNVDIDSLYYSNTNYYNNKPYNNNYYSPPKYNNPNYYNNVNLVNYGNYTNGNCGDAHQDYYYTAPTTKLCDDGNASRVSISSDRFSWTCYGYNGGRNMSCYAYRQNSSTYYHYENKYYKDGVCGSSNGKTFTYAPTSDLCLYGKASTVSFSGDRYTWTCYGYSGGRSVGCYSYRSGYFGYDDRNYTYNNGYYNNDDIGLYDAYKKCLGREPDIGGLNYWTAQIRNNCNPANTNCAWFQRAFCNSVGIQNIKSSCTFYVDECMVYGRHISNDEMRYISDLNNSAYHDSDGIAPCGNNDPNYVVLDCPKNCNSVGTYCGGGRIAGQIYEYGKNYTIVATLGGCTSGTNPSCYGGLDNLKKTWNNGMTRDWNYVIATDMTDGLVNTNELARSSSPESPYYVAKYCVDMANQGKSDWYLPSKNELNMMYQNRSVIGGFVNETYWSSTSYAGVYNSAFVQYFGNGSQSSSDKNNYNHVRCIRRVN